MRIHKTIVLLFSLGVVGCAGSDTYQPSVGKQVALGSTQRLTLPATQYQRVYVLAQPRQTLHVTVESISGTSPISLTLYPAVATKGGFVPPPANYALKPFQRTGLLPLTSEISLPSTWNPQNALVVEVKNIGSTGLEVNVHL
jgi:hypothetical protein